MMPFDVDVLGTLTEKLKQLTNEAKGLHNSFIELTKLYRGEKINEKDVDLRFSITLSRPQFLLSLWLG